MPEKLERYLQEIGEQIRWKRARPVLLQELKDHALEQLDTCLEQGLSQEEAEAETLRELGNPVEIGEALDRLHRPRPQWGLLLLTALLTLMGLSLQLWLLRGTDEFRPGHLILLALLGCGALIAGYFSNYVQLIRRSGWIYGGAVAAGLGLLVLSPQINQVHYYAHYASMLYPVVFALVLCRLRGRGWFGLLLGVGALLPLTAVCLLIPRLLDAAVLLLSGGILLLTAAWNGWFGLGRKRELTCTVGILLAGSLTVWPMRTAAVSRLTSAFHPEQDPVRGFLGMTIRSALNGAQPFGTGVLTGGQAGLNYWDTMPEAANDLFLVTVIHTLGWVPFFLLSGTLAALLVWALGKALRQTNCAVRFLALSILVLFAVHTAMSLLLTGGCVLLSAFCPFLKMSTETVLDLGLMGLLLSVYRQETLPYDGTARTVRCPRGRWKLVYEPAEP